MEAMRYWVRIRGNVEGPFPVHQLRKLPAFTLQTLVQPEGGVAWAPAYKAVDLKAYFSDAPKAKKEFQPFRTVDMLFGSPKVLRRPRQLLGGLAATLSVMAVLSVGITWQVISPFERLQLQNTALRLQHSLEQWSLFVGRDPRLQRALHDGEQKLTQVVKSIPPVKELVTILPANS